MPSPSPPIPIAFCITDLDVGGAERALVQLVTRLDRREWSPVVFCLSGPGPLVRELESAHVPVTCLAANRDDGFFRRLRIVWRLAREFRALSPRPRLLQTFLFHANLVGRIAGRLAGIERIVSGIRVAEKRARWHLWLDWLTNWLVDLNVCVSQSVADFTFERGRLRASKLSVIPNGVDYERFAQAEPADLTSLGIPRESRVIVTIGRLDEQKGHRFLIEAFPAVLREHREARLLIVGDGPLREELQALARQLGVTDAVCFAGYRDDVPALLRACPCFVLPSLWEGMPNVILEAMAAGVPVVATSVEGVRELIEPDRTGLVVKVGNAAEIASALHRLWGASALSLQLAQAAQQAVRERFTLDNSAKLYAQTYHQLLSR